MPTHDAHASEPTPAQPFGRRGGLGLATILAWTIIGQLLILAEAWPDNPFATAPVSDAAVYWDLAGRLAAGHGLGPTPHLSAPLYPWLLAALRALGGGLLAVYVFQAALHVLTAGLLTLGAARRFGVPIGLTAGGLFVLLLEPAYFTGRVLNCTLQLFLVVLLWLTLLHAQARPALHRWAPVGIVLGLNCLGNPPMLLALPLLAAWAWWQTGLRRGGLAATLVLVIAAATISPATIQNYRATGEFIPLSAQAGITLAAGNSPNARGTYQRIEGVSDTRQDQNTDALRRYRADTDESGGWNAANRYYVRQALAYWAGNPGDTAGLLARKLYWCLTGHNMGDIYIPGLERQYGLAHALWVAPLPVPWLVLPALVGLAALLRSPRRYAPEIILAALPLLVVLVFFYTPRYRLPAVPFIAVLCAGALVQAAQWRQRRAWAAAVAVSVGLTFALAVTNTIISFDSLTTYRKHFHFLRGNALTDAGRWPEAVAQYRRVLTLDPHDAPAAGNLGSLLVRLGQADAALPYLDQALTADPNDAVKHDQSGQALMALRQPGRALEHFRRAVELRPDVAAWRNDLASTLALTGDAAGAIEQYELALRLDPTLAQAHLNLGRVLQRQGQLAAALEHLREATRLDPHMLRGYIHAAQVLDAQGDRAGASATLRSAQAIAPQDPEIARALAALLTPAGSSPAGSTPP